METEAKTDFIIELKNLLVEYNADLYIEGGGDGFASEIVIYVNNKEVFRKLDGLTHHDFQIN